MGFTCVKQKWSKVTLRVRVLDNLSDPKGLRRLCLCQHDCKAQIRTRTSVSTSHWYSSSSELDAGSAPVCLSQPLWVAKTRQEQKIRAKLSLISSLLLSVEACGEQVATSAVTWVSPTVFEHQVSSPGCVTQWPQRRRQRPRPQDSATVIARRINLHVSFLTVFCV